MLNVEYNQNCEEYKLNKAILFYGNGYKTLATLHKIENKKLLAGKSLSVSDLEELFHSQTYNQKMSYFPPEILAWSRNEIIWFAKSAVRPIFFNVPEKNRLFLNKLSGKNVIWPNMVFRISRGNIYCWCVKNNRRPTENTQLYNPPFSNISREYRFCPPPQLRNLQEEDIIKYAMLAMDIFFRGHFSHISGFDINKKVMPCGRDKFWRKMIEDFEAGTVKTFPSHVLEASKFKLKDILQ